jgi:hypothetical protein
MPPFHNSPKALGLAGALNFDPSSSAAASFFAEMVQK